MLLSANILPKENGANPPMTEATKSNTMPQNLPRPD